ncbi:hypothetical protein KGD82_16820 [Nocardiopsis eucommiae]|uniref:Uncharacterized protein n=1 Tax=Nocardiopsis eucommiae TaxID=2831970 RepID=A0A975L803_9ACTN|nr:hypothetical protein KGD82_16820 [Nocardiopsis eucommiae]
MTTAALTALAVIVLGIAYIAHRTYKLVRTLMFSTLSDQVALHAQFLRDLEKRTRAEANAGDQFAVVVLDEIATHLDAIREASSAADKARQAAK